MVNVKQRFPVTCVGCGKEFFVIKSRVQTAKYCDKNCLGKANGERGKVAYRKRVEVPCTRCGKMVEKKPSVVWENNYCDRDCMAAHYAESGMFAGDKSGTWGGGKKSYYGETWRPQRRAARERDGYVCQRCGISEEGYGMELSVHHIVPFVYFDDSAEANVLENLISICEPCHRKEHSGENHPSKFARKLVDDIV